MTAMEAKMLQILQQSFGLPGFRPLQLEAIQNVLSGKDTLLILPTGGGKSLTYQLPALTRPHCFTVVVSPLIALMKDQMEKCQELDIDARFWNCTATFDQKQRILKELNDPELSLKLLFTTPESLQQEQLTEGLKEAYKHGTICSFALDEAHCISEWGHDFRQAYLTLSELKELFPLTPILALTASCTAQVQASILSILKIQNATVFKSSFNRPNITYQVRYKELMPSGPDKDGAIEDLVQFIKERPGQGGIVYARLRVTCDELSSALNSHDLDVGCYHAGRDSEHRARVQRDWSQRATDVVVATVAFGMGIDRADVRWVVHWNVPSSMEGFYQESGRAGRDGKPSLSVMYVSHEDIKEAQKMEKGTRRGAVTEVADYALFPGCRRKKVVQFLGEKRACCDGTCELKCDFCEAPRQVTSLLSRVDQAVEAKAAQACNTPTPRTCAQTATPRTSSWESAAVLRQASTSSSGSPHPSAEGSPHPAAAATPGATVVPGSNGFSRPRSVCPPPWQSAQQLQVSPGSETSKHPSPAAAIAPQIKRLRTASAGFKPPRLMSAVDGKEPSDKENGPTTAAAGPSCSVAPVALKRGFRPPLLRKA